MGEGHALIQTCRLSTDKISLTAELTVKNYKMLEETVCHLLELDKINGKNVIAELSERDCILGLNKIELLFM